MEHTTADDVETESGNLETRNLSTRGARRAIRTTIPSAFLKAELKMR